MSCTPCTPCSEACDPAHEPLASTVDNFVTHFFGPVTKTCVDGKVVWALPCDLDTGVPGFPRAEGEGVACYLKRMFVDLFANYGSFGTMALQNANDVAITGGMISGLPSPTSASQAVPKSYVDGKFRVFNVRDYGAVGNGTTDDTSAINQAVLAALVPIADGTGSTRVFATVHFPRGTYKITGPITATAPVDANYVHLKFTGEGPGISVISQFTAAANGFVVSLASAVAALTPRRTADFHDLTLLAQAACGQAIQVVYGSSSSYHQSPGCRFVNVAIQSLAGDGSKYWTNGLLLNHAWNAVIDNCLFSGNAASFTGRGLSLTGLCNNLTVTHSQFNFWDIGIAYTNDSLLPTDLNMEGLLLNQVWMVPVGTGVRVKGNPNAENQTAPLGQDWNLRYNYGRVALVSVVNSHIDARGGSGTAAVSLESVGGFMISSSALITAFGSAYFLLLDRAYEGTVTGNTFAGPVQVGVDVRGKSTNNTFTGNQFRQGGDANSPLAFRFWNETQYNIATNNTREINFPLRNEDNSTQDGGQSNNQVGQALNISAIVTTVGGTPAETFSVDISKAALGRKCPAIAATLNVGVGNIGVLYDWGDALNSRTVARIRVYTLDGSNLPAATTYRIGLAVNPGSY